MMNKVLSLAALFIAGMSFAQTPNVTTVQNETAMKYAETITIEDMKEDLTILASDALEGRETGKRGQKMAAAYIKAHFEELGLVGPVTNSSNPYYQDVPLITSKPGEIYVKFNEDKLTNLEDIFYYGKATNTNEISTKVVFVGAGTEKDFEGLDVKGKAILIINTDRNSRVKTMKLAAEKGVNVVFIVRSDTDEEFQTLVNRFAAFLSKETLSLDYGNKEDKSVGAFYLSPTKSAELFGKSFEKLTEAIDAAAKGKKNALKKIKPVNVKYKITFDSKKLISENVLGYLEGTDLKDEVLVLTSHYDHLGVGADGQIYNGADDDGSGTVAVMDIAEAFVKAKADGNGPRRSILFMTVTAEEKGLLGSAYYTENPIFSLESTVANLNIDMIGRIDDRELESESYVSLVGADKLSSELHEISENMNKLYTNLFLDYTYNDENHPERIFYRSDHWNFAKNGIPVIFYTTGSHPDYHKASDTVDKIEFELMTKRAKLVFYTAWEIANRDKRLIIDKGQKDDEVIK